MATYHETVQFLFQQLPVYQRDGSSAYKKDLGNISQLCRHLSNPQTRYRTIHIAGTNGKGSTAHMTASVLQAAGYKVGLYISPHYKDFRERIKVNGEYIPKREVVRFVEKNKAWFMPIKPSFFEITLAMAFDYFREVQVDVAVIETGLGGRLDSTNIITPIASIITNISFDHMQFLGDTYALIAGEKAGIIKKQIPVVIGERHPETTPVFEAKAREMNSSIVFAEDVFRAEVIQQELEYTTFQVYKNEQVLYPELRVQVSGDYQQKNIQTVVQGLETIADAGLPWQEEHLRQGLGNLLANTRFMGRWQVLGNQPLIITDSAHNTGGLQQAMAQLLRQPARQLHLVIGMVSDKDITQMLALLPKHARYYFVKANIPRGMPAPALQQKAAEQGLQGKAYSSVRKGLAAARLAATETDVIYVGGSTFVVAEVI